MYALLLVSISGRTGLQFNYLKPEKENNVKELSCQMMPNRMPKENCFL
jgi:hypothetical protein